MYRWRLIVKRIPVYKGQNNWKLSHSTKMLIMANLKNAQEKKTVLHYLYGPMTAN